MAGLQRSAVSFRRQGSSGSVWDDKFLNSLNQLANQQKEEKEKEKENNNNKPQQETKEDSTAAAAASTNSSPAAGLTIERSRSNGGRGFRTGKVSPAIEPPSPRVSACGFCGAFGKSNKTRRRPPKSGKRVM
ncbi:hypothetical protein BUALT_Bualt02G0109900 [Buddleja alternifolia]|uniref:MAPK kinase substrate protein n=1 Tax=Buddleja alternifolia TaxID=168488 RepID=A0AAV6Y5J2_9LAMI|nr:hypothetical protein BUALT_Bualt02G0109900 [Buddleja alternifolia]